MKDSEFKELLNLYLDHEITAQDAARLEAEVQSNPARRSVYQDYCRMQKACKMLAEDFASEPAADRKVVAFPAQARPARRQVAVLGSLAAAAACVALVFVVQSRKPAPSLDNGGLVAASPAPTAAATFASATEQPTVPVATVLTQEAPAPGGIHRHPANNLSLRQVAADALVLANTANTDPNFAWMQNLQLKPVELPSNELKLQVETTIAPTDRTYLGPRRPNGEALPIGFRFQK